MKKFLVKAAWSVGFRVKALGFGVGIPRSLPGLFSEKT